MNKIRICGYTYRVVFEQEPIIYDNELCEGYCDNVRQIIQVAGGMGHDRTRHILLHEIVHAIYHIFGDRAEWNQECVCDLVTSGTLQVLKDNPMWAEWFLT